MNYRLSHINQAESNVIYILKLLSQMFQEITLRKMQMHIKRRGCCSMPKSKIKKENNFVDRVIKKVLLRRYHSVELRH